MRWFFVFGFSLQLFASSFDSTIPSTPSEISSLTSELLSGYVSSSTGQLSIHQIDLHVKGAQDLFLTRAYLTPQLCADSKKTTKNATELQSKGWVVLPHLQSGMNQNSPYFQVRDPRGAVLEFEIVGNIGILKTASAGCSNLSGDSVSSVHDVRNIQLTVESGQIRVSWPDGTCRHYEQSAPGNYLLQEENLPNGKSIRYEYHKQNVTKIYSCDPSGKYIYASIKKEKNNHFVGSDGQVFDLLYQIKEIQGDCAEEPRRFNFPALTKATTPCYESVSEYNEQMLLSSYDAKEFPISFTYVDDLQDTPRVQTISTPSSEVSFTYDPAIVGKKEGSTTVTHPSGSQTIYRYNRSLLLYAIENLLNGTLYNQKLFSYNAKQQISKIETLDGSGQVLIATEYNCDATGNPILERVEGDFGVRTIKRVYSDNRLVSEEHDSGLKIQYTYLGTTRNLTSRTTLADGAIVRKNRYFYDESNNLIKEEEDGKRVTNYQLYHKGPNLHRIEWIEELDWIGNLITKKHLTYDRYGNISEESIYGSDGALAFQIVKTYDSKGNLIRQSNPLGQVTSLKYDNRGRVIQEIPFSGRLSIDKNYDAKGRLILLKEGDHITQFSYDAADHEIEKTDYLGLKTKTTYHSVHQKPTCIEAYPVRQEIRYDCLGREIERQDAYGASTKRTYDSLGNPTSIQYPDGGVSHFSYDAQGLLVESIDCDGLEVSYQYDSLGRLLSKAVGSRETTYTYDAYNLVKEVDGNGFTTQYQYNLAGKLQEKNYESRVTQFGYDSLGYLNYEETGGRVTTYENDVLGRILQKTVDSVLNTYYAYDGCGNLTSLSKGSPTTYLFDPYNRLTEIVDTEEFKTTISYEEGYHSLIKKITNPLGIQTLETYDAHGLLLIKEIPGSTLESFSYDCALRLSRRDQITFSYTKEGRIESIKDGSLNPTIWTYTPGGKIKTKTKPDGTVLHYDYNLHGELEHVEDRHFQYDQVGRLVEGTGFIRQLDPFGNILSEDFSTGLSVHSTFDPWDRPLQRTLPDQSTIDYQYEGPFLKKVTRNRVSPYDSYSHTYEQFDNFGNILSESNWYTTTYTYDKNGRQTYQKGPYLRESISYDPAGNLIQKGPSYYTYDDASRLLSDSSQFSWGYDKHQNCIEYLGLPNHPPKLDQNGNCIKPTFIYDPFDQLTEANGITNTYDSLGRRIKQGAISYLYLGDEEIGAYEKSKVRELKIPGAQNPISIEISNRPYIPIIDVQGTIRKLVEWNSGDELYENNCDPFGRGLTDSIPYAYAGKRFDRHTGLVYFGKRFYDPTQSRWLTSDPLGPIDHANLHQYLLNNPYKYTDPTGESLLGYVCGLGQMALGGAMVASGFGIQIATFGGYTLAFGFHEAAGLALITSGASLASYHSHNLSFEKRSHRPDPDPRADGASHTIIQSPGASGSYTTHNDDGTYKQYRGSGKPHGDIPRPNIKENKIEHSPEGDFPGQSTVIPNLIQKSPFKMQ